MANLNFERHFHSLSPDPPHPRSALYPAPPPSQRSDSPPKKRRSMGAQHKGSARSKTATCLPSAVLDADVDPAAVDFRNFFLYVPNEVKHRKRTSTEQAKVLEGVFDRNAKPDSALRQRLANELDMTPRGVQVWFQNRRAKEKLIGKKALAASATAFKKPSSPKEESYIEPEISPVSGRSSPNSTESPSPESSPTHQAHFSVPSEFHHLPPTWIDSQSISPKMPNHAVQPGPPQAPADLYNLRRPSLPTVIRPPHPNSGLCSPPPLGNLLARRGSVERLGGNPYARFLMSRVNSYQPRPTSLRESHDQASLHEDIPHPASDATAFEQHAFIGADGSRPMLEHRASVPHAFTGVDMQRRASMPSDLQSVPSSSAFRTPDRRMYAVSCRTVPAPIPGPLPTPNFSFGRPADSPGASSPLPVDNEGDYFPELANFSFGRRMDDNDTEDDATSTSYDAMSSRFGSIASMAGSESSNTSAYYSDVGSCNEPPEWNPEARRGSYASSGQFLDLVSGLDLSHGAHEDLARTPIENCDRSDVGSAMYTSPAPTVSAGRSHANSPLCTLANVSSQSLPISGSSELAHALQPTREQQTWDGAQPGPSKSSAVADTCSAPYIASNIYVHPSIEAGAVYQADPNMSSKSLPETAQNSFVDVESNHFSNTGHYHNPNPYPQPSPTDSHHSTTTPTGPYSPYNGQDILELHHAMEYHNSGYVAGAVDMSHVTTAVENTLCTQEPYLQYP